MPTRKKKKTNAGYSLPRLSGSVQAEKVTAEKLMHKKGRLAVIARKGAGFINNTFTGIFNSHVGPDNAVIPPSDDGRLYGSNHIDDATGDSDLNRIKSISPVTVKGVKRPAEHSETKDSGEALSHEVFSQQPKKDNTLLYIILAAVALMFILSQSKK